MNHQNVMKYFLLVGATTVLAMSANSLIAQTDSIKSTKSDQDSSEQLEVEMDKALKEMIRLSNQIREILEEKQSRFQIHTFRKSVTEMKSLLERAEKASDAIELNSIESQLKRQQVDIKSLRYEIAKQAVSRKRRAERKIAEEKAKQNLVPRALQLLQQAGINKESIEEIQRIIERDRKNGA